MRLLKLFSFAVLTFLISFAVMGASYAAVTVDGPYTDTMTQGDWTQKYATGGSCFYLLPTPPPLIFTEFNIDSTTPPPYCVGGSLAASWDIFANQGKPIYAYYFAPDNIDTETRPSTNGKHPADQWNPCKNQFYGATFDNGDLEGPRPIFEPLVSEVTVNYTGSFRIAYYFLEEYINHCREQNYNLFVNGKLYKTGIVSDFDTGKYAVFNINGLAGTSTIRLEVTNTLGTPCDNEQNYPNVHFSGIFIDKCNNQFQGCTPGYWKQSQHFASWTGYYPVSNGSTATMFCSVFNCPSSFSIMWSVKGRPSPVSAPTLLQALQANGGGINELARHATAALLNAANANVAYPRTETEIKNMVNAALAGCDIAGTASILAEWNESYWNGMHNCPLSKNP